MADYSSHYIENLLSSPPINYKDKHFLRVLKDLQANILHHHKKEYSSYLFLTFNEKKEAKKQLAVFAPNLTSAYRQLASKGKRTSDIIYGFYLSATGYKFLGLVHLCPQSSSAFNNGMSDEVTQGFDKDENDDIVQNGEEIHAMICLASDDIVSLEKETQKWKSAFEANELATVDLQRGFIMLDKDRKTSREWFGFVDGISQPRFFPSLNAIKSRTISATDVDNLGLILVEDPGGSVFETDVKPGREKDIKVRVSFGSYLAFMKLEQNVEAFEKLSTQIAEEKYENDLDTAKASIMGRFLNGKPLTLHQKGDKDFRKLSTENDFDYKTLSVENGKIVNDHSGEKCPFTSHIRKVNPRQQDLSYHKRKIARRGVLYVDGIKSFDEMHRDSYKEKKVGMLFMSFQRSIEEQFEFVVKNLMHNKFSVPENKLTGRDMLTGRRPLSNGDKPMVTFKGGLYLFAPSISFMKNMKQHFPSVERTPKMPEKPPTDIFTADGGLRLKPIWFNDERDDVIDAILGIEPKVGENYNS